MSAGTVPPLSTRMVDSRVHSPGMSVSTVSTIYTRCSARSRALAGGGLISGLGLPTAEGTNAAGRLPHGDDGPQHGRRPSCVGQASARWSHTNLPGRLMAAPVSSISKSALAFADRHNPDSRSRCIAVVVPAHVKKPTLANDVGPVPFGFCCARNRAVAIAQVEKRVSSASMPTVGAT